MEIKSPLTQEEQQRLQQLMTELDTYQRTAEILSRHLELLMSSLSELSITSDAVEKLKEVKPDTDTLVPLGSDTFVTAKMSKPNHLLMGLGANVMAERDPGEAIQTLKSRADELEKAIEEGNEQLQQIYERTEKIKPEANKLLKKAKS
jgi:prefoldin alpha subunit